MTKKIITFCGKKFTGKTSGAKFLVGYCLKSAGLIDGFSQDQEGNLIVPVEGKDGETDWGELDVYRKDEQFLAWAKSQMFPHVQIFSFASELKEAIINIFGVDRELVYGCEEEKNKKTHIKWSNMTKLLPSEENFKKKGYVSVRELLQIFGTDICRTLDDNCWIKSTFRKIEASPAKVCVIDDCRFENEFNYCKKKKAHTILLKKTETEDPVHSSEQFEFPEDKIDLIINKSEVSLAEKNQLIEKNLIENDILEQILTVEI